MINRNSRPFFAIAIPQGQLVSLWQRAERITMATGGRIVIRDEMAPVPLVETVETLFSGIHLLVSRFWIFFSSFRR